MSKGMVVKDRNEVLEVRKNKNNIPFLLGSNMQRYKYEYKFYANYDNLKIVGGTNSLKKHSTLPRLLIRRTGNIICAAFSDKLELLESTIYFLVSKEINLKYLLAILNSKLLTFYLKQKLLTNAQGFPQILMWQLDKLPIPKIDFTNPAEKKKHDEIVNLVETMLELNRELQKTKSAEEQERLNQRISYTDKKIDALVYELYDLTEEEIKVVEGE
jgi:hypothetical protein